MNYSSTELECLAIIWATQVFRPYIWGVRFTLITDHEALTWLQSMTATSAKLVRWRLRLQEYNFKIRHRSAARHKNVDALSRLVKPNQSGTQEIVMLMKEETEEKFEEAEWMSK